MAGDKLWRGDIATVADFVAMDACLCTTRSRGGRQGASGVARRVLHAGLREQQPITDCLMERLYVGAKQRGERDSPVEFAVIDEADGLTADGPEHISNRMVKKLRKFGVGMVLAGQDGRKVDPLSTIRPRQTAFAGVAMAEENRPIAEIRLARPA